MATEAATDVSALPSASGARLDRFPCHLCKRTYERQDHLSRHLKSHDNERKYKCADCGKGFNRADLLNRHRAAHLKHSSKEHFRRRTGKACQACITAKAKCDEDRPCRRCDSRGTPCIPTDRLQPRSGSDHVDMGTSMGAREDDAARTILGLSQTADMEPDTTVLDSDFSYQDAGNVNTMPVDAFGFPDFFDSIMTDNYQTYGDNIATQALFQPPDVSNFMQDIDLNTFDFDFSLLENGLTRSSTPQPDHATGSQSADTPRSDAELRTKAFQNSPWSWNHWIPPSKHSSFAGINELHAPPQRVHTSDQLTPKGSSAHIELETEARDRLLRLVSQMGDSRVAISSFPSLELLHDLLDVFFVQELNVVHNFLHVASFDPRHARTELLLAIVAAGATFVALPPVWRMGLVMQEVIRVAVGTSIEKDNAMTRDLSHLQSWLLMLHIGIWSGFRRKTEVASAFLQTSLAMLTWSNAFSRPRYKDIIPSWNDANEQLEAKWKQWIEQESFKRLCFRYFIHDSQVSIAHLQNPLLSAAQLMLPLPASKILWKAQNAQSWRNHFLSSRQPRESQLPSAMVLSSNMRLLDTLEGQVDKSLSIIIACHCLAYGVFHFRQQALLLSHGQTRPRHDRLLAQSSRQKEIYEDLICMHTYCELQAQPLSEAIFTLEYLMMSLHVSLDDIQLFSGRSGEEEARRVYPKVREWCEDPTSRVTVWHAGQVFKMAQCLEHTLLRDFYAVALYHATLTLWVYGLVTSHRSRKEETQTPVTGGGPNVQLSLSSSLNVFIDGEDDRTAKAFRHLGQGRPCLITAVPVGAFVTSGSGNICPLDDSKGLMTMAAEVLKSNFPNSVNGLPPLVENLVNLMIDLSTLSGKVST